MTGLKIGSGSELSLEETNIIESRMFTDDEAKRMCPSGIRLFFQVKKVENYNNSILSTYDEKYESIAEDIIMNWDDPVLAQKYLDAFAKKSRVDAGGLPHKIIFVYDLPYVLTKNIDVSDGIANGNVGKLIHLEFDNTTVIRVWLLFPDKNVGKKIRHKFAHRIEELNINK